MVGDSIDHRATQPSKLNVAVPCSALMVMFSALGHRLWITALICVVINSVFIVVHLVFLCLSLRLARLLAVPSTGIKAELGTGTVGHGAGVGASLSCS